MNSSIRTRLRIIIYIVLMLLAALLLRLYFLQVISGELYAEMASESIAREKFTAAPRGNIYDRNGKLLVRSIPVAAVAVEPNILLSNDRAIELLGGYLDMDNGEIRQKLENADVSYLERVLLKTGIDKPVIIAIKENMDRLPGVEIVDIYLREYEYGVLASHILGYTGEIDKEKLASKQYGDYYSGGDQIGLTGLEEYYENMLRGEKGSIIYEVDPLGRPVSIRQEIPAKSGNDLYLTIDIDLQKVTEEALHNGIMEIREKTLTNSKEHYNVPGGAVVVLNAKNGEVLSMASFPTNDPGVFSGGISSKDWTYLNDPANYYPLNNRAVMSYAPGSVFKVITAYAGLQENVISEFGRVSCAGIWYGLGPDFPKFCWNKSGHGSLEIRGAIKNSCDSYFYEVGYRLLVKLKNTGELLQKYARDFGFGKITGIDLPFEDKGRVPDSEWKKEYFKDRVEYSVWFPGDTVNMAIGQGDLLVTPIQMAMVYSTVANRGMQYEPHLVKEIRDPLGELFIESTMVNWKEIDLNENYLEIMEDGFGMVTSPGGTAAYTFRNFPISEIPIAGKTSTAEVSGKQDYAWFASYGPIGNPEYVIVVMLEEAGGGGSNASPIAEKIYRYLFGLD
ncbi:MAG: penicillin-binding protein 2 [Actinobacteria bacterium]|nr:penicillin-binding protein 2 [Actinomycetota bacterium]